MAPKRGAGARPALLVVGVVASALAGWGAWAMAAEPGAGETADASVTAVTQTATATATPSTPSPSVTSEAPAEPSTPPGLDLTTYSASDPSSIWVVVNKQHPVTPLTWAPDDLVAVGSLRLRAEAAEHLQQLLDAASADGVHIGLRTGYRSYDQQAAIRADLEARKGYEHAEKYSARPGYSEHQTGLALDLDSTTQPGCGLKLCFADTVEGQWVAAHAEEFGFIIRYTDDNADVTGYSGEPWHLRYVGTDLVQYMAEHDLTTLEETLGVTGGDTYAEP
ncbi:M15 family metallopeptidase [Actinotalea sp. M2MS4P-6]|uniref:M15 family metallopeptidase n=1 Tax=Actinotalea sp. M2MS4P-6 TaxID=2983762 RepID=UPI0021E3761A|nr:M15 family metallopeptidase [Actinotalea sp. M2MS4P-6]MCV2395281.1 M15 family metallopeptidase [Actinotalea sp. M2MS4P-6]